MLVWPECNWITISIACVVSEILFSQPKWLGFFPDVSWTKFMQCELNISANTVLSVVISFSVFKIIPSGFESRSYLRFRYHCCSKREVCSDNFRVKIHSKRLWGMPKTNTDHIKIILNILLIFLNRLHANSRKWSKTLKQFVAKSQRIVWAWLSNLRGWGLKGKELIKNVMY